MTLRAGVTARRKAETKVQWQALATKGSLSAMMMILLISLRPPKDQQFPSAELLALEELLPLEGEAGNAKGPTPYHPQMTAKIVLKPASSY